VAGLGRGGLVLCAQCSARPHGLLRPPHWGGWGGRAGGLGGGVAIFKNEEVLKILAWFFLVLLLGQNSATMGGCAPP